MVRRKPLQEESAESPSRSSVKRARPDPEDGNDTLAETPSKRQRGSLQLKKIADVYDVPDDDLPKDSASEIEQPTPTPKRKRGRPRKDATPLTNGIATPSKLRQSQNLETPTKSTGTNGFTPRKKAAVDRSAKRKSARALIERVVGDDISEEEDEGGLARAIYESSEDDDEDDTEAAAATTPSKKTPARKGRPPKIRSPTPPRDLPAHEMYFEHNKPGRTKTSNNTLASIDLLTHDEYFSIIRDLKDHHAEDLVFLQSLHEGSFGQWSFELAEGFSLCLYGLGCKRPLLTRFAEHTYAKIQKHDRHKIVIVNGYVRTITLRDILNTVASTLALDPTHKLPAQPSAMLQALLSHLTEAGMTLTLLLNSIDAPPLRKPATQQALAALAAHPNIRFLCSADTPDFSLLWDAALRASFNFLFHDTTTFARPAAELDPVDDVHDLLGRRARAINGKEGVVFVLASLPENAKSLFRLLVAEVLIAAEDGDDGDDSAAVEYRMLYNKAVEEFICSSEMAFRTLLKEFHDHQMITSSKDAIGTELLSVPFRKDELEGILEELMT
ncbi:Origin recognition complex subunit 2 like protein [Verticillium longisporum]|uniref:Origin recognition complex subunit 2 n=1 Tax=Verticillium longisporum TaxID=100787 RepID=A0A8I2ZLN6_VERLO|nr:Origin recognition complex subunit 2 like protein [Verticillium longisporum]